MIRGVSSLRSLMVVVLSAAALMLGIAGPPPAAAQAPGIDGPPECGQEAPPAGVGAVPDDGVLRVATYNVLHTQGDYDDETLDVRVDLIVDALAVDGADAVGLQEVVASANHGLVAQRLADGLAGATGDTWSWCYFRSNPHLPLEPDTGPGGVGGPISMAIAGVARPGDSPWSEGLAIISRFPISSSTAHRLVPRTAEAPLCQVADPTNPLAIPTCAFDTRSVLHARTTTSCGPLDLFTTHLANNASPLTEQQRLLQVTDALAQIDRLAPIDEAPDVLTGDFNTLEGGIVHQAALDAGFVDGFRQASPSAPGFTAGQQIDSPEPTVSARIDYVFARPGTEPIAPSDATVLGDAPVPFTGTEGEPVVWPSDHYGVSVSLPFAQPCSAAVLIPPATEVAPAPTGPGAASGGTATDVLPRTGDDLGPSTRMLLALVTLAALATVVRLRSRSAAIR